MDEPPADLLGITPVDVARAAGHATLANMLQQHFFGSEKDPGQVKSKGYGKQWLQNGGDGLQSQRIQSSKSA